MSKAIVEYHSGKKVIFKVEDVLVYRLNHRSGQQQPQVISDYTRAADWDYLAECILHKLPIVVKNGTDREPYQIISTDRVVRIVNLETRIKGDDSESEK